MESRTRISRVEARAHETPATDPAAWLLLAVVLVVLALALGTWLALVLPAAI
jgi:hypothetical protein